MRVSKVITLVVPLGVALLTATGPALAEHGGGPCRQDIQTLCPDITPGPGSFRDCLAQHAAELSPACQKHLAQFQAKMTAWRQACQDDVQAFCGNVAPGPRNIRRCLRQHQDELSQPCQDQLAQHPWHHHHHCAAPTPGGAPSDN
jgi:hypothetical protein